MMTPEEFLEHRRFQGAIIAAAQRKISNAHDEAARCPVPRNVRPATIDDIKPGVILWTPDADKGHKKWLIVDSLIDPDQPREPEFKWFYSEGSRYGIDGTFIEVE